MHKTLRQAIDDLYALSKVADREEAERICEIIALLQSLAELAEHEDEQTDIYMKLSRS